MICGFGINRQSKRLLSSQAAPMKQRPNCDHKKLVCPLAWWADESAAEIDRLTAEAARLRSGLEEIAAMRKIPFSRITPGNVISVAERALGQQDVEKK